MSKKNPANTTISEEIAELAISKAINAKVVKEYSKNTAPGTYQVDLTCRVRGTLTKGNDFEKTMPNKVKWTLLVALLASKVNDETLDSVFNTYLKAEESGEFGDIEAQIKSKAQSMVDNAKGQTKTSVSGPVTSALVVDVRKGAKIEKLGS